MQIWVLRIMSKSPAFQFYAADFLIGCMGMSDEEIGVYIKMLCAQWELGSLPNCVKSIRKLINSRRIPSNLVMLKFERCDDGFLRNMRLEKERQKQAEFRATRVNNARKRWEAASTSNARASKPEQPSAMHVHDASTCKTDALHTSSSSSDNIQPPPTPNATTPAAGELELTDWGAMTRDQAFATLKQHFPDIDVWGEYQRFKKVRADEGRKPDWRGLISWLKKAAPVADLGRKNPDRVPRAPQPQGTPVSEEEQAAAAEELRRLREGMA